MAEVTVTQEIINVTPGTTPVVNVTGESSPVEVTSGSPTVVEVSVTEKIVPIPASNPAGVQVPPGGTTGQVLEKASGTDYHLKWGDKSSGGGGPGTVTSVAGVSPDGSGNVPLAAADVGADASGAAASAVSTHEAAADPHPQYTTAAESAAAAPVQSVAGRTGNVTLAAADIGGLGDAATLDVGTTAGTVAAGDDARLSDARTPTAHTHPSTDISDSTAIGRAVLTAVDAAAARTAIDSPSSAQLAAVSAVAYSALPTTGGTMTGTTETRVPNNANIWLFGSADGSTTLERAVWDGGNLHIYYGASHRINLNGYGLAFDGNGSFSQVVTSNGAYFAGDAVNANNPIVHCGEGSYATAANPLTSIALYRILTWAWNGSNGYSIASTSDLRQIQRSATAGDAFLQFTADGQWRFGIDLVTGDVYSRGAVVPGTFTTATLPLAPPAGSTAYKSDATKYGEVAGSGTGIPIYYSDGAWRSYRTDKPLGEDIQYDAHDEYAISISVSTGTIAAGAYPAAISARSACKLKRLVLKTVGGTCTVDIHINGVSVASASAGLTKTKTTIDVDIAVDDEVDFVVSAVSGATWLWAQADGDAAV